MNKVCIDLCSGLGGFSRAFVDAGWEVITVDIDPKFNPTIVCDVTDFHKLFEKIFDICNWLKGYESIAILMSPPCERFSLARRTWPEDGIKSALEIVGSCLQFVVEVKKLHVVKKENLHWALENPKGRLRWFLGKPLITIRQSDYGGKWAKPTDIWGNISLPMVEGIRPFEKSWAVTKAKGRTSLVVSDPAKRAFMPYGLSQAVLEAVESQP